MNALKALERDSVALVKERILAMQRLKIVEVRHLINKIDGLLLQNELWKKFANKRERENAISAQVFVNKIASLDF